MTALLYIQVVDSCGDEHRFDDSPGDEEIYLDMQPSYGGEVIPSAILITTRTLTKSGEPDCDVESYFFAPRQINIMYENGKPQEQNDKAS